MAERSRVRPGTKHIQPLALGRGPRKLQTGVIYHPVHGYPIQPPVPVAVSRRNARERTRVKTVNDSYQHLKSHVPAAARTKRMSKVDIIKHSIEYIQKLQAMVRAAQDNRNNFAQESSDPNYEVPQTLAANPFAQYYTQGFPDQEPSVTPIPTLQTQTCLPLPVPVSPSSSVFSSCSSSSNFSLPSSSSSLPQTVSHQAYSADSLLDNIDDDILDVIAEWQDS